MNYADELVSMLRPLGVYSFQEGSFSLAELQALGAALDAADEAFGAAQKESIVMTAQDEGLSKMEALFRSKPPAKTVDARRAAIAGFLRISGDSFTLAALNRCLCACGVACSVEETGEVNRVKVWFPGVMGIPDGFAAVAPLQPHHEGEQCAALSQSEVVPEILHIVHFETRCTLFTQRGKIHAVAVAFVFGLNATPGEKIADGNPVAVWYDSHFFRKFVEKTM